MSSSSPYYLYYVPSRPLAVAGLAWFAAFAALHLLQVLRTKKYFGGPIVVACGCESDKRQSARTISVDHVASEPLYIIQAILILLAPILFAAGIYMFLGRLITATTLTDLSIIRVTRLTKLFVLGDVLCFLIQAFGATKLVNSTDAGSIKTGQDIIVFGLVLQFFIFGFFVCVASVFHWRISKNDLAAKVPPSVRLSTMLLTLYTASGLVMLRSIYLFVEYVESTRRLLAKSQMAGLWTGYLIHGNRQRAHAGVVLVRLCIRASRNKKSYRSSFVSRTRIEPPGRIQSGTTHGTSRLV
ncbi:hypothetical protein ANO11243_071200 [Dothideomycetidae sp. 11243]|nr:hypothetical protein ANO11243_071200 [fungal sp. No.11243]